MNFFWKKMTKDERKKEAVDIENRNRQLIQLVVPTIIGPIPGSTRSFYANFMWELVWLRL
jgi:glycyl-tRNA synthetase (class II)